MKPHRDPALKLTINPPKTSEKVNIIEATCNIVLALLLYLGLGGLVISLFGLPVLGVVPAILGFLIMLCAFVFCRSFKIRLLGVAMLIVCVVILWVLAAEFAQAGLSLIFNRISEVSDIEMLRINAQYEVNVPPEIYDACGTFFILPFAIFLSLVCVRVVERGYRLFGVAVLALLAVVSAFEAVNHSGMWAVLLGVGAAFLVCRSLSATYKTSDSGTVLLPAGGILLASCLLGALIIAVFPGDAFGKLSYLLERNQRDIMAAVDYFRYESGSNSVFPQGEFSEIAEPDISFNTTLELTTNEPQSIYLRGYVGEVYTDFGWKPLSKKTLHNYTALFYQLHKNNFYPQTQLTHLARILDDSLTDEKMITLKIKNSGAHRGSIYAPYELFKADEALLPSDKLVESGLYNRGFFGTTEYTMTMLPNQIKRHNALADMLADQMQNPSQALVDYLTQESRYRSFVYEQYTAISQQDSKLLTAYIGEPGIAGQTHVAYKDAKNNILAILTKHLEQSYDNGAFDGNGSFLRYIMRQNQSASTVSYASLAVMMLRHYGIPARYVEGYIIVPDEAEGMVANEPYNLTDDHEHAWAEYYHDGIGWIPFEVDPKYLGVMEGINDPPTGSQSAQGDGGGEDEEDTPDKPERDRDRNKGDLGSQILSVILPWLLLLLTLAALVGAWLFMRKKRIEKRKKACGQSDDNAAVESIKRYLLALLSAVAIAQPNKTPDHLLPVIAQAWGKEWGEAYSPVAAVLLKHAFSQNDVTPAERGLVHAFLIRAIAYIDETQSKKKRFIIRYIKCLY